MRRVLAALAAAALLASFAVAPVSAAQATTCPGGVIGPGTYGPLTVTGTCVIAQGTVIVDGGLTVAPNATLMAITSHARLTVNGGIAVAPGGVLLLGCAPSLTDLCGADTSYVVNGNITATQPLALILHGNTINGAVTSTGGGGGVGCAPMLLGGQVPAYTTLEGNRIAGGVRISGLGSCWMGMARNAIHGSVLLSGNTLADPDAMEILSNTIYGGLACWANSPAPKSSADAEDPSAPRIPMPNTVTGRQSGQCASI